jgi:hypothetical protein
MTTLKSLEIIDEGAMKSAMAIKQFDLKNRKKFPHIPTRIIDNFFDTPQGWRAWGLDQEFETSKDGTWPGKRTRPINEIDDDMFERFAKKLLEVSPEFRGFTNLVAQYHLVDETYVKGWVHDDDPFLDLVGLVYLNKSAPLGSGTTLYSDKYDTDADKYRGYFKEDVLFSDAEGRQKLNEARDDHRSHFKPNMEIENVFNRCVIYDPRVWHSPNNYFGKTLEDSRLTLVFFAQGVRK